VRLKNPSSPSCSDITCSDVSSLRVRRVGQKQSDRGERRDEIHKDHITAQRGHEDSLLPVQKNVIVSMNECVGEKKVNSLRSTSDVLHSIHDLLETNDPSSSSSSSSSAQVGLSAEHGVSSVERLLSSINDLLETRLRSDARLRHQTDKNQQMMNEWMIAAAVIDRICFIVFSLCFVIGTAVLFILATSVQR